MVLVFVKNAPFLMKYMLFVSIPTWRVPVCFLSSRPFGKHSPSIYVFKRHCFSRLVKIKVDKKFVQTSLLSHFKKAPTVDALLNPPPPAQEDVDLLASLSDKSVDPTWDDVPIDVKAKIIAIADEWSGVEDDCSA